LWSLFTIGGSEVQIRRRLWGGGSIRHSPPRGGLVRALILIAGPAANVLMAATLLSLAVPMGESGDRLAEIAASWAFGAAALNALLGLANAAPFGKARYSDGRQLRRLIFQGRRRRIPLEEAPPLVVATAYSRLGQFEAATRFSLKALEDEPRSVSAASMVMHCMSRSSGDGAALGWWLAAAFIPPEDASQTELAFLRANVAWSALKAGRMDLSAMVDSYSQLALDAAPERWEMRGTRGAWLVESGDFGAGVPMLTVAAREAEDQSDKAHLCRFLSQAMLKCDREAFARAYSAAAEICEQPQDDRNLFRWLEASLA
jgi:hypothetical protein